jgi:imidazolonepropionase-like amidohydrolase
MSALIWGATIIDGLGEKAIEGKSIWIDECRIKAIGNRDELRVPATARVIDVRGKYAIPGLMNANVHLLCDVRFENLARYQGRYDELIAEAAQVALKNGLTTVFDTWGPRRYLMAVRDRINAGETPGSRIFCAGNIIGFDGPFSPDFIAKAPEVASAALVKRVNSTWVENVGRHLMWLTPEQVAHEVRAYIGKGIDFIKYASNEHGAQAVGAFLQFSPQVQAGIIDEAHRAGKTAQAHSMSVEGLRIAIEAGCDLIQHANITGPTPIPESTLDLFLRRKAAAAVFPFTQRRLDWLFNTTSEGGFGTELVHTMYRAADSNVRNLIRSGTKLLLANDAGIFAPEVTTDPTLGQWTGLDVDNYWDLNQGHFFWFKAMEEKGMAPMEMLRAATRNIAEAYGKDKDLGTVEAGKIADLVILDKDPLQSSENYRSIHMIFKDGAVVDREALPIHSILTKPMEPPTEEAASYIPFLSRGNLPTCPMCMCR